MNERKNTVKHIVALATLLVFCFASPVMASSEGDGVLGEWLTDMEGTELARVNIYLEDGKYFGRITWLEFPVFRDDDEQGLAGKVKVDRENPDPALRNRPVLGLVILKDFEYRGAWKWKGGTIYDPENGKTYRGVIRLTSGGTLKMRGYVGIPLFGRTTVWTRVGEEPGSQ